MFCSSCGAENVDTSGFCTNCGKPLPGVHAQEPAMDSFQQQPEQAIKKPIKKKKGCLVAIISVLAVIVILVILVLMNGGEINFTTARLTDATMASEIDPATSLPVVITDEFLQDDTVIYVTAYAKNVPTDTKVSVIWTYVPSGETFEDEPIYLKGDAQFVFSVEMPSGFIPGEYSVDILIDDKIEKTLSFSVS